MEEKTDDIDMDIDSFLAEVATPAISISREDNTSPTAPHTSIHSVATDITTTTQINVGNIPPIGHCDLSTSSEGNEYVKASPNCFVNIAPQPSSSACSGITLLARQAEGQPHTLLTLTQDPEGKTVLTSASGNKVPLFSIAGPLLLPVKLEGKGQGYSALLPVNLNTDLQQPAANQQVDVDKQCGVWDIVDQQYRQCTRAFSCKLHWVGQKRAVPGRSRPFDELVSKNVAPKIPDFHQEELPENIKDALTHGEVNEDLEEDSHLNNKSSNENHEDIDVMKTTDDAIGQNLEIEEGTSISLDKTSNAEMTSSASRVLPASAQNTSTSSSAKTVVYKGKYTPYKLLQLFPSCPLGSGDELLQNTRKGEKILMVNPNKNKFLSHSPQKIRADISETDPDGVEQAEVDSCKITREGEAQPKKKKVPTATLR